MFFVLINAGAAQSCINYVVSGSRTKRLYRIQKLIILSRFFICIKSNVYVIFSLSPPSYQKQYVYFFLSSLLASYQIDERGN